MEVKNRNLRASVCVPRCVRAISACVQRCVRVHVCTINSSNSPGFKDFRVKRKSLFVDIHSKPYSLSFPLIQMSHFMTSFFTSISHQIPEVKQNAALTFCFSENYGNTSNKAMLFNTLQGFLCKKVLHMFNLYKDAQLYQKYMQAPNNMGNMYSCFIIE